MKKYFRYGLFFALGAMLALGFVACGDESSSGPSKNEETGIETEVSSSSEISSHCESCKDEAISSSRVKDEASSSSKKVESSSSTKAEVSSSSTKIESSSSSVNVKESSSSKTPEESSSSGKPVESSSSKAKSSSSEISSSSVKPEESSSSESSSSVKLVESSSSEESSSSLNPVESSSSEMSSSSSPALNSVYDAENNTLTDLRDGQVYKTVTIGLQVWMAENLNYLPKDTVGTFWAGRSVCGGGEYKSLQEGDCSIYGRLYESDFTENEKKKQAICPDGWTIPKKTQYEQLISFLGNDAIKKLKIVDSGFWSQTNLPTNESGFSAKPSGYYSSFKGFNYNDGEKDAIAVFATEYYAAKNSIRINDDDSYDFMGHGQMLFIAFRCIKK